ncbi:MAG: hypothetical protein J6P36_03125 [Lachnospiraceae bacterium]|jgi:hypothetical protein|nr:hypothetical protein [Lachnospiraceae bacterium]MBQ1853014.1 hypothetical protein [Lachnospiraceae bacterium]
MKEYAEGYDPNAEEKPQVDESVQLIREVSASKEFVSKHSTKTGRRGVDSIYRIVLCYGLIVVGVAMIILAAVSKNEEYSSLYVGGILFAALGIVLEFLSRNIKKD